MFLKISLNIHIPSYLPQAEAAFPNLQPANFPTEPAFFQKQPANFSAEPPRNRQKSHYDHENPPPIHSPIMKEYEGMKLHIFRNIS